MPIRIRDAEADDLAAILAITNEAIANTTAIWTSAPMTLEARRAWFDGRRAAGLPVLVAVDEAERVLGFASFGEFRTFEGYLQTVEHSIYVDAGARRRGVGSQLLAALIGRAEALGKRVMVAAIEADNEASIRLHQRFGFEECGRMREVGYKFGRWLDLVLMQRVLGPAEAAELR